RARQAALAAWSNAAVEGDRFMGLFDKLRGPPSKNRFAHLLMDRMRKVGEEGVLRYDSGISHRSQPPSPSTFAVDEDRPRHGQCGRLATGSRRFCGRGLTAPAVRWVD